jgi:uncharacterized protein (DUF2252 family)
MTGMADRLAADDDWTKSSRRGDGKAARDAVPRAAQAEYRAPADRDPLGIIERQNATRIQQLVPLRVTRMLQDPFAFYRGTAALQAADLAGGVVSGANVMLCGDAHITNFGVYSSPQRQLVFDINDFDETAVGPWEWDVKRLVTSVVIAVQQRGWPDKVARKSALAAARSYREGVRSATELDVLERYYLRVDVKPDDSMTPAARTAIEEAIKAASKRTSARAFARLVQVGDDGVPRIAEDPPTLSHLSDEDYALVGAFVEAYRATLPSDLALLLSKYRFVDAALRVVGVGSVGTRCYVLAFTGPSNEPLVLQVKEAGLSALVEFGGLPLVIPPGTDAELARTRPGYRVVAGQRILQAVSDPFLGHVTGERAAFYVRQFRDGNVSFDTREMTEDTFRRYVALCGRLLARGHAQSPDADFVAGYLGGGDDFDVAVAEWAEAYADQSRADFDAFAAAAASGRFPVAN